MNLLNSNQSNNVLTSHLSGHAHSASWSELKLNWDKHETQQRNQHCVQGCWNKCNIAILFIFIFAKNKWQLYSISHLRADHYQSRGNSFSRRCDRCHHEKQVTWNIEVEMRDIGWKKHCLISWLNITLPNIHTPLFLCVYSITTLCIQSGWLFSNLFPLLNLWYK